jgi:hypothetical protein
MRDDSELWLDRKGTTAGANQLSLKHANKENVRILSRPGREPNFQNREKQRERERERERVCVCVKWGCTRWQEPRNLDGSASLDSTSPHSLFAPTRSWVSLVTYVCFRLMSSMICRQHALSIFSLLCWVQYNRLLARYPVNDFSLSLYVCVCVCGQE